MATKRFEVEYQRRSELAKYSDLSRVPVRSVVVEAKSKAEAISIADEVMGRENLRARLIKPGVAAKLSYPTSNYVPIDWDSFLSLPLTDEVVDEPELPEETPAAWPGPAALPPETPDETPDESPDDAAYERELNDVLAELREATADYKRRIQELDDKEAAHQAEIDRVCLETTNYHEEFCAEIDAEERAQKKRRRQMIAVSVVGTIAVVAAVYWRSHDWQMAAAALLLTAIVAAYFVIPKGPSTDPIPAPSLPPSEQ